MRPKAENGGSTKCTPEITEAYCEAIRQGHKPIQAARICGLNIQTVYTWRNTTATVPAWIEFRRRSNEAQAEGRRRILAGLQAVAVPHDEVVIKATDDGEEITTKRGVINLRAAELLLERYDHEPDDPPPEVPTDRRELLEARAEALWREARAAGSSQAQAALERQLAATQDELQALLAPKADPIAAMPRADFLALCERRGEELDHDTVMAFLRGFAKRNGKRLPDLAELPDAEGEDDGA